MKKLLPLSLWILGSLASPVVLADASDWAPVTSNQQQYRLLINAKTFQREDDVVNATFRYVYANPQVFPFLNVKYDHIERRFAFQCKEHKMVALGNNYYQGEAKVHSVDPTAGNPFQPKGQPLVPQKIEANSMDDEAFNQACHFKAAKK